MSEILADARPADAPTADRPPVSHADHDQTCLPWSRKFPIPGATGADLDTCCGEQQTREERAEALVRDSPPVAAGANGFEELYAAHFHG
jgi:hypothetical protein